MVKTIYSPAQGNVAFHLHWNFWLTMTSQIESFNMTWYTLLTKNEQFESKIFQWRLLIWIPKMFTFKWLKHYWMIVILNGDQNMDSFAGAELVIWIPTHLNFKPPFVWFSDVFQFFGTQISCSHCIFVDSTMYSQWNKIL